MDVLARDGGDCIGYGLCAIDNVTKMVSVIPIKNRSPSELIRGLKLIIEELGKPKQIYSDEGRKNSLDLSMEIVLKLFRHQHMHILLSDLPEHPH